jgi:CheY-like chemotaxis protein
VWNLLSNAIKFTPAGGTVRVQLRRVNSAVELQISDNGAGIDPEFLQHIFQRFSQADASITRNRTGLGVGLAIVKSLVELHGGTVSVSSAGKEQGSTFTVSLPVYGGRTIRNLPSAGTPVLHRSFLNGATDLTGLKILVVDDEPDTCNLLRYIFVECGAIVETALSAESALETIDRWRPDIMISDISMPNMDGFELIRILRRERKNPIPAVALTAMARVEDRLKALSAGFQLHVPKPVEPSELIAVASTLVGLIEKKPVGNGKPMQNE